MARTDLTVTVADLRDQLAAWRQETRQAVPLLRLAVIAMKKTDPFTAELLNQAVDRLADLLDDPPPHPRHTTPRSLR